MGDAHNFIIGKDVSVNLDTDDCIVWPLYKNSEGYGRKTDRSLPQRVVLAHRWMWWKIHGSFPDGQIDHLCRNPSCVNPRHLEPVTAAVNQARAREHWTPKTICKHGHEGAYVVRGGKRRCNECIKISSARYRSTHRDQIAECKRAWSEKRRLGPAT